MDEAVDPDASPQNAAGRLDQLEAGRLDRLIDHREFLYEVMERARTRLRPLGRA